MRTCATDRALKAFLVERFPAAKPLVTCLGILGTVSVFGVHASSAHSFGEGRIPSCCREKAVVAVQTMAGWSARMSAAGRKIYRREGGCCGFRLFSVYDGHAGDKAVRLVEQILPGILATHLRDEHDVEIAISQNFRAIDSELAKALAAGSGKAVDVMISSGTVACIVPVKCKLQ